jgi:hypothetical protein
LGADDLLPGARAWGRCFAGLSELGDLATDRAKAVNPVKRIVAAIKKPPQPMILSIAFTVYPVSDMAAARKFYENLLGLTISRNFNEEWVEYDLGEGTFAITTTKMGHSPGAKGR